MTALEYMEKQVQIHRNNLDRELARNAPKETITGLITKIRYYVDAVEALRMENIPLNESGEIEFDYNAEDM